MANEFNHFRILFSLYDKFYNGFRDWQDTNVIINENDLRYINRNTIFADIEFLSGLGLINTKSVVVGASSTTLRISAQGIQRINFILDDYPKFLQHTGDEELNDQANHILAIPNDYSKRQQTYFYIKQKPSVFESFLQSTKAISSASIPLNKIDSKDTSVKITEIINSLFNLNQLSRKKFGFPLFKSDAKLLNDLRQDGNDQDWFALQLTRIATLIDEIYYDEIKKQVTNPPNRSINLLEALFQLWKISFDKTAFQGLRTLHKLRSTITPIHGGEHEAIEIFKNMGISYPVRNWSEAGKKCLEEFLSCINKLVTALK